MMVKRWLVFLKKGLARLLEWAVTLLAAVLVLVVLWQIFTRFALNRPSRWTEELAKMLLIWLSMLGSSVAYARKGHLGVDYFVGKLDPASRRLVEIAVHLLVAGFAAAAMVYGGMELVRRTLEFKQHSAALGISIGYVYLAVPISGCFFILFAMESIFEQWIGIEKRDAAGEEQP